MISLSRVDAFIVRSCWPSNVPTAESDALVGTLLVGQLRGPSMCLLSLFSFPPLRTSHSAQFYFSGHKRTIIQRCTFHLASVSCSQASQTIARRCSRQRRFSFLSPYADSLDIFLSFQIDARAVRRAAGVRYRDAWHAPRLRFRPGVSMMVQRGIALCDTINNTSEQ